MEDLDTDEDGMVSWMTFSDWNRRNTIDGVVLHVKSSFDVPEFKVKSAI